MSEMTISVDFFCSFKAGLESELNLSTDGSRQRWDLRHSLKSDTSQSVL
jgi:hypothetical protein